ILASVFFLALSCLLPAFPAFSRLRPPSARLRNPRRSPLRSAAGRPWSCFSQIYCINLDDRPDRWGFMEKQFQ
ncbi:morn5, partial [Symbiodinium sp. CCMP2456]